MIAAPPSANVPSFVLLEGHGDHDKTCLAQRTHDREDERKRVLLVDPSNARVRPIAAGEPTLDRHFLGYHKNTISRALVADEV